MYAALTHVMPVTIHEARSISTSSFIARICKLFLFVETSSAKFHARDSPILRDAGPLPQFEYTLRIRFSWKNHAPWKTSY